MLEAISSLAKGRPEQDKEHRAVYNYLYACNQLFENGTLSHQPIYNESSNVLKNMKQGFEFFESWRNTLLSGIIIHQH